MSFGIYKGVSECLSHSFAHEIPHVLYKRFKRVISMVLNPKIEASLFDWTWPFTETSSSIKIPLSTVSSFIQLFVVLKSHLAWACFANWFVFVPQENNLHYGFLLKTLPWQWPTLLVPKYWCQGKQLKLIWLGILPQSYFSFLLKLSIGKVPERNGVMDGAVYLCD